MNIEREEVLLSLYTGAITVVFVGKCGTSVLVGTISLLECMQTYG